MVDIQCSTYEEARAVAVSKQGVITRSGQGYSVSVPDADADRMRFTDAEVIGAWCEWYQRPKAMFWERHAVQVGWDRSANLTRDGIWLARHRHPNMHLITKLVEHGITGVDPAVLQQERAITVVYYHLIRQHADDCQGGGLPRAQYTRQDVEITMQKIREAQERDPYLHMSGETREYMPSQTAMGPDGHPIRIFRG